MPEGRSPISSARLSTGDIARHSFAIVRRGYDLDEVKAYLQTVARSIEVLEQREQELRAAVAEAEERAAHPVVDEATLTASLGQHSAQILRHAHDEAAKIVLQAQEGASTLLREAQNAGQRDPGPQRGRLGRAGGRSRAHGGQRQAGGAREVEQIRLDAVAEGEAVVARAKEEGRALLEQVQEARKRVMADLTGRRRALSIQIEQLRAARDEMAAAVQGVRGSMDEILAQLERSDDDARAAAQAAGDQARLHLPKDVLDDGAGHGRRAGRGSGARRQRTVGGRAVRPHPGRHRRGDGAGEATQGTGADGDVAVGRAMATATEPTGRRQGRHGRRQRRRRRRPSPMARPDAEAEEEGPDQRAHRPARRAALADIGTALAPHKACARR